VEALQFHSNQQVQWVNHFLLVQGVSGSRPGDAKTHNGTGFLLLALSHYFGDPEVFDHWPCPRLCACAPVSIVSLQLTIFFHYFTIREDFNFHHLRL
jgi:hypothetical protein